MQTLNQPVEVTLLYWLLLVILWMFVNLFSLIVQLLYWPNKRSDKHDGEEPHCMLLLSWIHFPQTHRTQQNSNALGLRQPCLTKYWHLINSLPRPHCLFLCDDGQYYYHTLLLHMQYACICFHLIVNRRGIITIAAYRSWLVLHTQHVCRVQA